MGSIGSLTSDFPEEQKQSRRWSILSALEQPRGFDVVDDGTTAMEQVERKKPRVDLSEVRKTMETFARSMAISQESQQSIHDWDKRMGLKRSHSKTMRLSSRSRKKLRSTMKKEINALSHAR